LLEPTGKRRSRAYRLLAWRILRGLQKAAIVFHNSRATRQEILRHGLLPADRLIHAPLGIAPEYCLAEPRSEPTPREPATAPFLLHVGSCIPRKRMDVLLEVFARVRTSFPNLQLIKVGGPWSASQSEQITALGIKPALTQLAGLDRSAIADLYRRAALVLLPSDAEGFGLPILEALACGSIVVASDLPALREVGGEAVVYCPAGAVAAWADTVGRLLAAPETAPDRATRLAQAGRFSWAEHARTILSAYQRLL
jgi:glycosyltransferase involved in cell wall biosynthesis